MKDLKTLKKQLKIWRIIQYSSITAIILGIILIVSIKNGTIAGLGAATTIISIVLLLISKKFVKDKKETIKQIEIVKIGNEESKNK